MRNLVKVSYILSVFAAISVVAGPLTVGPDYKRPETEIPTEYKAAPLGTWKEAQPADHLPKGNWWELFGDPVLNALEA